MKRPRRERRIFVEPSLFLGRTTTNTKDATGMSISSLGRKRAKQLATLFLMSTIATMWTASNVQPVHSLSLNTSGGVANRAHLNIYTHSDSSKRKTSSSLLLATPSSPSQSSSTSGAKRKPRHNQQNPNRRNNNSNRNIYRNGNAAAAPTNPVADSRWQRAVRIETRTQIALENLQQRNNINTMNTETNTITKHKTDESNQQDTEKNSTSDQRLSPTGKNTVIIRRRNSGVFSSVPPDNKSDDTASAPQTPVQRNPSVPFPDIRECNFALAAFGDRGDLLRALRLYFKMRKATQIALSATTDAAANPKEATTLVPTPTLVTYSTLMSRAISVGKPQVALRLWKIMRKQVDFFSYASYSTTAAATGTGSVASIKATDLQNLIVPDVKATNILMNTYAKMGDLEAAEDLMLQMQTRPVLQQENEITGNGVGNGIDNDNPKTKSSPTTSSLQQVVFGGGMDVPFLKPNLVTYNTLLDACQKSGELEKALYWKGVLEHESKKMGRGSGRTNITYRTGQTLSIRLRPDVRTYTSLIGTVARKSRPLLSSSAAETSNSNNSSTNNNHSQFYGTHDPSLAFSLLNEMKTKHRIAPSPLTYSALIDVCGRCRRSDLALKALRLMLRDEQMRKRMRRLAEKNNTNSNNKNRPGPGAAAPEVSMDQQTVGAWTAAINACGKTGRIDTALKIFFVSMPRFKVQPNVITCSCLLDSLLKQGKTAESLDVLRYMKSHNLQPSEYIYTSLMTYASRLAGLEQQKGMRRNQNYFPRDEQQDTTYNPRSTANTGTSEDEDSDNTNRPWPSLLDSVQNENAIEEKVRDAFDDKQNGEEDDTKAVDIYSELMSTLIATTKTSQQSSSIPKFPPDSVVAASNELYQVSMVFREMKASGVVPDLGSYHTLLRSCANAGDIDRAQEILKEIQDSAVDLQPNDRTWRAVLRAAGKAKRSDLVLKTWNSAVADMDENSENDEVEVGAPATSKSSSSSTSTAWKKKKRKANKLSIHTFRTLLTALLVCAWSLRESDHYTSVELYKIVIKCYNTLRSTAASNPTEKSCSGQSVIASSKLTTSYMGLHLLDSNAAMENPQIMASILQAVVNLESLLEKDDEWKGKLKRLGVSLARTSCLRESLQPSSDNQQTKSVTPPLSYFDKKALRIARTWS